MKGNMEERASRAAKFLLHNSAAQGRMHYCKPKEK